MHPESTRGAIRPAEAYHGREEHSHADRLALSSRKFIQVKISLNFFFKKGLHKTFKDNKFVYLLTDAYLGGDLWRLLHSKGPFSDTNARFYVGCVLEAFAYLHKR